MISFKKFLLESRSGTPDWEAVKSFFGTCPDGDYTTAYYILPDGSFLDLELRGGEVDLDIPPPEHDDISRYDGPGRRFRNREDAMNLGAIRVMANSDNYAYIQIYLKPTRQQMDAIYDFVDFLEKDDVHTRDNLYVELGSGRDSKSESFLFGDFGKAIGFIRSETGASLWENEDKTDWESIKRFFGTVTDGNYTYAHFILPDGSFISLWRGDDDYDVSHDDISRYNGPGKHFRGRSDFMDEGAIRITASGSGASLIEMSTTPTKRQMDALYDFIDFLKEGSEFQYEDVEVEIIDGMKRKYMEFPIDRADRAIGFIRNETGATLEESLEIPPNLDDEIEMEIRRTMYGDEPQVDAPRKPEGMSDEKWAQIQAKNAGKNSDKKAAKIREKTAHGDIFRKYGDVILRWYRADKAKSQTDEDELRQVYLKDIGNLVDMFKTYEKYLAELKERGLTRNRIKRLSGPEGKETVVEIDPAGAFNTRWLGTREAGRIFMQELRNMLRDVDPERPKRYAIQPEDEKNIRLFASTENVMCWATKTWKSTNKLVFQLWQNAETLGRGDVYGDPSEQTPYCTHSKEHWEEYAGNLESQEYEQYWFLKKPEGEFDWTPGDLSKENVRTIFSAMKGKGPELLLAMDDTDGDFLDRNDRHSMEVEYIGEIMKIERDTIYKDQIEQWKSRGIGKLSETHRTFDIDVPERIRPFIE